ncbi:MAG: spore germination protein GerW family protein [Candidatus Hatepunaea meridiana]|nr:spore germination protein GerW family protein [Candidatus Hatepunaea meridiana]
MPNQTQEIIDTILTKLRNLASTETVVGEPIAVGEITILPVIKISVGFGAGGGEGSQGEGKNTKGVGGGGGGGASVNPIGFIVLDGKDVRFMGIGKGKFESLFETIPDLLRKFGITKKDGQGKKGKGSKDGKEHKDDAVVDED